MKSLTNNDFATKDLTKITTTLNQGYECEVKYASERVSVIKIKRKLLYKITNESDIKNYLIDSLVELIKTNPTAKVEFKRENDKIAIVLVKRQEIKQAKGRYQKRFFIQVERTTYQTQRTRESRKTRKGGHRKV